MLSARAAGPIVGSTPGVPPWRWTDASGTGASLINAPRQPVTSWAPAQDNYGGVSTAPACVDPGDPFRK